MSRSTLTACPGVPGETKRLSNSGLGSAAKAMDPALQAELIRQELGSILAPDNFDAEMDAMEARLDKEDREMGLPTPPKGVQPSPMGRFPAQKSSFDVPFAIGRAQ